MSTKLNFCSQIPFPLAREFLHARKLPENDIRYATQAQHYRDSKHRTFFVPEAESSKMAKIVESGGTVEDVDMDLLLGWTEDSNTGKRRGLCKSMNAGLCGRKGSQ